MSNIHARARGRWRAPPGVTLCGLIVSATAAAAGTAPIASGNLVRNGGGETGAAARDASHTVKPAGWTTTAGFSAVQYAAGGGFSDAAASKAITGGKHFFAGGPSSAGLVATATQIVVVPAAFRKDELKVTAALSAALGGYSTQKDNAAVTATFLDSSEAKLGALRVGPVTPAQRGSATKLVPVTKKTAFPAGTTSVKVVITATTFGGYNDGYVDNVALRLSA